MLFSLYIRQSFPDARLGWGGERTLAETETSRLEYRENYRSTPKTLASGLRLSYFYLLLQHSMKLLEVVDCTRANNDRLGETANLSKAIVL